MIIGPPRSGKGTITTVLSGLVGFQNVASPTLSGLGAPFGLSILLGKTVAIIHDARLSKRTDAAIVTERLLSISGGDSQTIDRKFLPLVNARLPVKLMLTSNELPKFPDSSQALPGRMIVLQLTRSWLHDEDTTLGERLFKELPGIMLWAIKGWQRIQDRRYFIQPDSAKNLISDLEDLASPVGAFVRDCCKLAPNAQIERGVLYAAWQSWCEEQGIQDEGEATFGRDLRAAVLSLEDSQPRTESGRKRCYVGIGLK